MPESMLAGALQLSPSNVTIWSGYAMASQNTEDTTTFYNGNNTSYQEILKGAVVVPETAKPFVRTVAKYFHATQD